MNDETKASEPQAPETEQREEAERDLPLPPASFQELVLPLRFQVEISLGLMHFGEEKDKPKPDLKVAQHYIDLMGILAEKTKGNLTLDEQRLLENSLTELRFRFVQVAEELRKR